MSGAPVKLTREQRAKVRSLMEDEGWSRAEAVAWVLQFESGTVVRGQVVS